MYVFVSGRDRALKFSSMLRGQRSRLGSIENVSALSDLPITIVDVSAVEGTEDRLGHFTLATSPSLIALVGGMSNVGIQMFENEAQTPSLFETTINAFYDVTMVVLQPLAR